MTDNPNQLAPRTTSPQAFSSLSMAERPFSLRDVWKTLRRRKNVILWITFVCLLLAVAYSVLSPHLYQADAKLEILKQNAATDLGDPSQASASLAADALDFNLAAQTQVDILQSRALALRVMRELGMNEISDYELHGKAVLKGEEASPQATEYALKRFSGRLKVNLVSGTRLISVTFLDRSPQRAAQVVNQLIADFIDHNFQTRFTASEQATSFLSSELERLKQQVDVSQTNAVRLQQESGIYGVDETNNATNAKLEQLNAQVTAAQSNLALKRSVYNLALTRNPEILAGMIGAQGTGANTANAPLQLLRQQQADAAANYAELNAHYGSQYPKVVQAGEKLRAIQTSIQSEINRLTGQASAEYRVAVDTEASASRALAQQKTLAARMNHDAIVYTSAKHEADTSRDLYEQLLHRLKEAGILAGIRSSNLKVLDAAIAPSKLAQPMVLLSLLAALLIGLGLGSVAALLFDAFDSHVRDPQLIEDASDAPVLGLLPTARKSLPKAAVLSMKKTAGDIWEYETTARIPRSSVAEAFRSLRTAVLTLLRRKHWSVLAVTSTSEGEGKSFTAFNLAAAIAQSGRTVIVVDADLRKHTLSDSLGYKDREGLDEATFNTSWQKYVQTYSELPGLFVMPAGQHTHNPADLLGSDALATLIGSLRESFDLVLIDTPSILAVTDTVSLSSVVDAVLIVAKCGYTQQHSLSRTLSILRRNGAKVLGIVLNEFDFSSSDYYYYWGKQTSGYEASEQEILSPTPQIMPSRGIARRGFAAGIVLAGCLFSHTLHGQQTGQIANGVVQSPDDSSLAEMARPVGQQGRVRLPMPGQPQDAPQGIVIGVGDMLNISVYDAPELTQSVRVAADGTVHLTLLGDIRADGLQPDQLSAALEARYKDANLIRSPNVSVELKDFATQGLTVEGEVNKPGIYPVYSARSLVDVLAIAGGRTDTADTHVTIRRRQTHKLERVELLQSDSDQQAHSDVRVFPGDTVIVPRAGLAYVLGSVTRPGGYVMRDGGSMTVLQAISEAQGTTRLASKDKIFLLRKTNDGTITIPIALKAMERGKEPDQRLINGDVLYVPASGVRTFIQDTSAITASLSGAALYAVAR